MAAWRVLAGRSKAHLQPVAKRADSGFESGTGRVLGTSEAFLVPTPGFY